MSDDPRALRNTLRDLKRSGFIWPPPPAPSASFGPVIVGLELDELRHDELTRELHREELEEEETKRAAERETLQRAHGIAPPAPPESPEQRMDRLFESLKEAKTYLQLADEHLQACQTKLKAAQTEYDAACAERTKASTQLETIKAEFLAAVAA
jgi:hypothetical protein